MSSKLTMNRNELLTELSAKLDDVPLLDLVELLRSFKKEGGTQSDAYEVLEQLRDKQTDGEIEDKVLELVDFVVGYCAPHMRIWD